MSFIQATADFLSSTNGYICRNINKFSVSSKEEISFNQKLSIVEIVQYSNDSLSSSQLELNTLKKALLRIKKSVDQKNNANFLRIAAIYIAAISNYLQGIEFRDSSNLLAQAIWKIDVKLKDIE